MRTPKFVYERVAEWGEILGALERETQHMRDALAHMAEADTSEALTIAATEYRDAAESVHALANEL